MVISSELANSAFLIHHQGFL